MSAIKQQLLALGVAAENMHYEVFGPHADLYRHDTDLREFTLRSV